MRKKELSPLDASRLALIAMHSPATRKSSRVRLLDITRELADDELRAAGRALIAGTSLHHIDDRTVRKMVEDLRRWCTYCRTFPRRS